MGSGKTTLLQKLAWGIWNIYPEEVIIWRGMFSCQWTNFLELKMPVRLIYIGPEPIAVNPYTGDPVFLAELAELKPCSDINEVLGALGPDRVNVVYLWAPDPVSFTKSWLDLFEALVSRPHGWVSIFFDELEDLAPSSSVGELWAQVERAARIIKEFRKRLISFYAASQVYSDVDYRVFRKFQWQAYLRGARVPRGSRLWQKAVDALKTGWLWLVGGGEYTTYPFAPVPLGPPVLITNYK